VKAASGPQEAFSSRRTISHISASEAARAINRAMVIGQFDGPEDYRQFWPLC
jgi:hypothetical protein